MACGILVPQPGIEHESPELESGFLIIGQPGRSQICTPLESKVNRVLLAVDALFLDSGCNSPTSPKLENTAVISLLSDLCYLASESESVQSLSGVQLLCDPMDCGPPDSSVR